MMEKQIHFALLNIDKPARLTSHDVVARVRRGLHLKRVGHAGTLDPMATGVLVVCLGAATRLSEYVMGHPKTYRAEVRLGITTTTYDVEGDITAQNDSPISQAVFEQALPRFVGELQQVPPMYSAIKKGGEKLYEKARRGETVELDPRPVTIFDIVLESYAYPHATLLVRCSLGTYIRSLAHDIGATLGVGAHLSGLRRVASGENFTIDNAVPLADFEAALQDGTWQDYLLDVSLGLGQLPRVELSNSETERVRNGSFVPLGLGNDGPIQAWSEDGTLLAIMTSREGGLWKPDKVFNLR